MADSLPIIETPRKFPPGCGPNAPKTGAAFRWIFQSDDFRSQAGTPTKEAPVPARGGVREKLLEKLKVFRERCDSIQASNPEVKRVDMMAFKELKRRLSVGNAKSAGSILGVEVGDKFNYRAELVLAGVHSKLQNGIDYALLKGRIIATCVVAKEGYSDKMHDPNFLWYEGEGGFLSRSKASDRVMRAGNLALKNSYEMKNEVRVVRGVRVPFKNDGSVVYVYDGLYEVVDWRKKKKGRKGNVVFEFDLRRKSGQKTINWNRI